MFRILKNQTFVVVDNFLQRDIIENRIFLLLKSSFFSNIDDGSVRSLTIPLRITAKSLKHNFLVGLVNKVLLK